MTASQYTIAGTVLTMPVNIRKATQRMAVFSVDADAAQRTIDYSGLKVARFLPGRAAVALVLAHFIDGDLGEYHELSTNVMVNQPGSTVSGFRALQSAFIHHMLVDQSFTLEAGRTIWGFPKVMADFRIREADRFGFDVTVDGQLVVDMEFQRGLRVPSALTYREQQLRSYSHRDGHTLETGFSMSTVGSRYRPGGVRLRLGDHPYAKELASLGLPKRAMLSTSAANVQMSFGNAQEIS
ncbi:acetoacetate decarboxylase family protein [Mycobacterium fragae]|uniref:Acetoacetate decarboxylase n=1 Tax=Mycobacterium fragae TaxID=1260918 RepID=A0A1X1UPC5_9MYCO|nr:acetoacetate decarboxylase family protein [Mycobacterium fragae]MCV7400178.1 acetoacetate decarboxylase family protein [Mycobacterium fragae]ORV58518.1 acetoacetate decarboxylase [Mycobacterium fragae]